MLEQRDQQELKLRLTGIWDVGVCVCAQLHPIKFVILWTVALQAPLSVEFSRQEYWSSLPFPPPGNLPDPGMETVSCIGRWILNHYATWEALGMFRNC